MLANGELLLRLFLTSARRGTLENVFRQSGQEFNVIIRLCHML
jgi:hypothetical protein